MALELQVLGSGLDHQLARPELVELGGRLQSYLGGLGLVGRPAAALRTAREVGPQPFDPCSERLGPGVVQVGLVARQARELGDPGAHRARPRDADPLDHLPSPGAGGGGSPSQSSTASRRK